jgi:hypothetical protein
MWSRLRRTFRSGTHDDEIKEELEFHLHGDATEGRSLRDARLRLGNPKRIQEETREAGIVGWLESVLQDARYGSRQFSRAPGLFLAVVLSLAIGIGANSAIFSLIDAAVLRPLPVADPGALFQLEWRNDEIPAGAAQLQRSPSSTDGGVQAAMVSEPVFRSLAEAETGLVSLVGLSGSTDEVGLSGAAGAPAQPVRRQYVSRSFFDGLGVPPVLGRGFIDEEDRPGAEPSVIVSHRFWSNSLGSDPDVIDGFVEINDQPVRLVGVAPPGFFGLNRGEWIDVYQPLGTHPFFNISVSGPYSPSTYWSVTAVARVAPGESGSAAAARLTPLFRGLVAETTGTEIEDGLELVAVPAG